MSKYLPISKWLEIQDENKITISIQDIESMLGFRLPASAFKYQEWWANDKYHTQAKAWMNAGYRTVNVKTVFTERFIIFEKKNKL